MVNFEPIRTQYLIIMKNTITYNVTFAFIISFFCYSLNAQRTKTPENNSVSVYEKNKRADDFIKLKKLGYQEKEIFEDLGNAHFLAENYETALFWYEKFRAVSAEGTLSKGFQKRYEYTVAKTSDSETAVAMNREDWLAAIRRDYEVEESNNSHDNKYRRLDSKLILQGNMKSQLLGANNDDLGEELKEGYGYKAPISLTADGKTAFFSKAVYVKPPIGIFSKKEVVHKIYRADKKNGRWQNVREIAVCPKYSSALHPAVSYDGKRLFFTSDMPGSYGKYDIYVSNIRKDGSLGVAMNLGEKVNTKKNDMYPRIVGTSTLFFASDGRKGLGGLDVYMAQVNSTNVGLAINLGDTLNSREDDYAVRFMPENDMAYVISSRGKSAGDLHQVAFSYSQPGDHIPEENTAYNILEAINNESKMDLSSSVFEDE